jgi:hypothetical protein
MNRNLRLIMTCIGSLVCLSGCGNGRTFSPVSPSAPQAPPPRPSSDDFASLSGSYSVNMIVFSANPALECDPRRAGVEETIRIDLTIDGDTRVVEAAIVRDSGQTTHLRGTVSDSFLVTAKSDSNGARADSAAPTCPGSASETLTLSLSGPNYVGCPMYMVQIETAYSFASEQIVERMFQGNC